MEMKKVLFYNGLYKGMRIKATIVAYSFLVQCFENATIMAYVGLRVKIIVGFQYHLV